MLAELMPFQTFDLRPSFSFLKPLAILTNGDDATIQSHTLPDLAVSQLSAYGVCIACSSFSALKASSVIGTVCVLRLRQSRL